MCVLISGKRTLDMNHCNTKSNVINFIWVMEKQKENEREGKRRKGSPPSSPHALKTKKGVKVLNIKLPRTPLLPTHPVRFPHQRSHMDGRGDSETNPPTKTSPHSPRAKYLRGRPGGHPLPRC